MSPLDRRTFLAGAGVLAAAPALGPVRRRAGRAVASRFEWGVASFDPTADSVLLWARVAPRPPDDELLRWVVARDEALTEVVASGQVVVGATSDHCAVVEAHGLEPSTTWWYAFSTEEDERSVVGRTRTMAVDGSTPVRLGVVSCSRFASGGFAAYAALADREVDVVVHLGDYIYEDGLSGARAHEPPERLRSLEQYRARYAQHRRDPDLQQLHARHPMIAVWDDHEVSGNAWRDGALGHDPAADGPWLARLVAAGQAHEEWLPGRTGRGADGRLRAWRSLPLGGLGELVVLDTRTWGRDRQPSTATEVGGPPPGGAPGSVRSMLGADQARVVAERLRATDRPTWTVLANQVMFHPLRVPVPVESLSDQVVDAGFLVVDSEAVNPDQWDGYPQAREELSVAMGGAGGVVLLTGDVHSSWAWEGPADDGGQPAMVELVAPSVSSESLASRLPLPAAPVETALRALDPELSYVELSSRGYLLVDLTPERVQAEWWYVDPDTAGSQRFGAARAAPRTVPMHLTEVADRLPEPIATTTTTGGPTAMAADDDVPVAAIGAAGAAVVAATAAAIAVRRRAH
jgi:alkaline phosphatase D